MAKISPQLKAYIIGSLFPDRTLANEYYDRLENLCTQYYPVSEALQDYIANYFFPGKKHLSQQLLRIVNNYPYCTPPVMNDELTYALRSQIKGDMELGWEYRRVFDQVCDVCYGYTTTLSLEDSAGLEFVNVLINGLSYSLGSTAVGGGLFHFDLEQAIATQIEIATGTIPTDVQIYNQDGTFNIVIGGAPFADYAFQVAGTIVGTLTMSQTGCPVTNYCPVSCITPQGILGIQDPATDGDGYYLTQDNNTYQMYVSGSPTGPLIECPSMYSDFYWVDIGKDEHYGPYAFNHQSDVWYEIMKLTVTSSTIGVSVSFNIPGADTSLAGNIFTFQYSTDFGQTWVDGDTYTALQVANGVTQAITEPSYRWRILMSTPHTCEFYSATITSSEYGFYYAQVDDAIPGFALSGYTINGQAMDNVSLGATVMKSVNAATIGGYGLIGSGDSALFWFAGWESEQTNITVIDRDNNPVSLTWVQFTPALIQDTYFTPLPSSYDSGLTGLFVFDIVTTILLDPAGTNSFMDSGFLAALKSGLSYFLNNNSNFNVGMTTPGNDVYIMITNGYFPLYGGSWQQISLPSTEFGTFTFTTTL